MKRGGRLILILIAVACFGVALSYPISYWIAQRSNSATLNDLSALRQRALSSQLTATPGPTPEPEPVNADHTEDLQTGPTSTPQAEDGGPRPTRTIEPVQIAEDIGDEDGGAEMFIIDAPPETPTPVPTASPTPQPEPSPTPDRSVRTKPVAYPMKEKVSLDEEKILPELQEIYDLNHDLVGWISIEGTAVDYPVVKTEDPIYYLTHDFFGVENKNGQIVLEPLCDPYTPSYNLVISGHNMLSGSMFAKLLDYASRDYWEKHKIVEFDTLMERNQYVVMAVFFSADYDEYEEGFRYSADIQYERDAEQWLEEIRKNQLYKTGIEAEFGDEFLTLTTCTSQRRKNGRFVVICRKIREGETF